MLMTFIAIISGEGLNETVPIFFFEAAFVVALIASPRIPRVGWLIAVVIFVHLAVLLYWLAFLFAVPVPSASAAQSLGARGLTVLLMLPLVAQMALLIWRLGSSAEQSEDSLSPKASANQ